MSYALTIKNLSVRAGSKSILQNLDFLPEARGLTAIMGPMGGGKSTLLKFITATLPAGELTVSFDTAEYAGKPLEPANCPLSISQQLRQAGDSRTVSAEARMAKIDEVVAGNNKTLCIDEPTAGLEPDAGRVVMEKLNRIAAERAVLMVSHNTAEVKDYCHNVALIGGGHVVTSLPVGRFFDMKTDKHATHYLSTGGLDLPHSGTSVLFLSPEHRVSPEGFDHSPANPAPFKENWVLQDRLSLVHLPAGSKGGFCADNFARLSPPRTVLHFLNDGLQIYNAQGSLEKTFAWNTLAEQADRNPPLAVEICNELQNRIEQGEMVTIDTGFNQSTAAAILGAFMILRKFSPESALKYTALKFPELHLGMRLEQFLWDIDLQITT